MELFAENFGKTKVGKLTARSDFDNYQSSKLQKHQMLSIPAQLKMKQNSKEIEKVKVYTQQSFFPAMPGK